MTKCELIFSFEAGLCSKFHILQFTNYIKIYLSLRFCINILLANSRVDAGRFYIRLVVVSCAKENFSGLGIGGIWNSSHPETFLRNEGTVGLFNA